MKNVLFTLGLMLLAVACSKDAGLESVATNGQSGSITRFAVFQNHMYVLNLNEVQTYDLSDPDHPALVHRLPTEYGLETITLYDNTIFLGSTQFLYILDISDPAAPKIQGKSDRVLELGFGGCDPVVVKDNYAYSTIKIIENVCGRVSSESALVVYDISDYSNPTIVGTYFLGIPNGLGYKDNYLFVCDEGVDLLRVFDISNPLELVETTQTLAITDPYDLIVYGEKMIVSTKTGFEIFDLTDLSEVRKIGQITK